MSRILSAVFFALAGVSIPPSCSSRGGGLPVVLVEAFAPATTPSRHQRSNSHYHHHGQIRPIPIGPKILSAFSKEQQQKLSLFTSTSTSLGSAKVLPFLYTGFSGALLYKAVALGTRPRMDSIVLLAFSALTFFNLGPSDNAKLGSGKLACKQTAATEEDDQHQQLLREKAATWRKSVRIKIIVQIVGLFRMVLAKQTEGLMRGAAMILGASILYISSGGGEAPPRRRRELETNAGKGNHGGVGHRCNSVRCGAGGSGVLVGGRCGASRSVCRCGMDTDGRGHGWNPGGNPPICEGSERF